MKKNNSIITIHMVSSLDGYIARKDNSVDWMNSTDYYAAGHSLSDEEIKSFLEGVDCYVIGSRTYEQTKLLGWPYGDTPVVVLAQRRLLDERKNVQFYSGDLEVLIDQQLKPRYTNIWVAGGSQLVKSFLQKNLADEIVVSVMPVLLGKGLLFFDGLQHEVKLHLKDAKAYKDGMVELHYEILKDD